jgi:hypothetical protein
VIVATHSVGKITARRDHAWQIRETTDIRIGRIGENAMKTSRRTLLAGMAGLAAVPGAASAFNPRPAVTGMTVAEERFARMIAAAHAPDINCARQAEGYADAHWPDYVGAARAVLNARA